MDIKNNFDRKYKSNPNAFGSEPIEILKKGLEFIKEGEALLLGVGNGRNASYLLDKGFRVTGVDVSEVGLELLKKKYENNENLNLILGNASEINLNKEFDLVTAIGLLHFFDEEDIKKTIENIKKHTKTKGFNIIVVRMTQNPMGTLPHIFSNNELKEFYDNSEWEIKIYQEKNVGDKEVASILAQKK